MTFAPIAWLARFGFGMGTLLAVAGSVAAALANPFPTMALGLAVGVSRLRRGRRGSLYSQGTARFASQLDLARGGLLTDRGLIVGRTGKLDRPSRWAAVRSLFSLRIRSDDATRAFVAAFLGSKGNAGRFIKVRDYVHLATFAPTGRGKGQSVLKPNLLQFPGSVVVVDPDAELFRSVGDHRAEAFGHRNIVLAPFGVPGRAGMACDTLNPLTFIDAASPYFLDDSSKLAALLVVRSGEEKETHFLDATELVLTALIAFTVACVPNPEERTFQLIRSIATSPDRFAKTLDYMISFGGVIARLGHQLKWFRDRELGSVMTTLQLMTKFLDSPLVAANTAKTTFDPAVLRDRASLWLVLPSDRMAGLSQVLRIWVGTILTRLTRDVADESKTVLFLIDEAANIGHIPQLEEAVVLLRKRGIRIWFFWQSLQQLSKCYGERAGVFLDNIDTQQYFGLNAYESAEAISKRLGQETILVRSHNDSSGSSQQHSGPGGPGGSGSNSGSGSTVSEQGRALMRPEEILQSDATIIFHRNLPPILAALPLAHADPEFQPATRARRRPVGVAALVLSLGWLGGGAAVFGWGTDQASGLRLDTPSLAVPAVVGRLWQAMQPADASMLSDAEIDDQRREAISRADGWAAAQYRAARQFHPLRIPPELRPAAITAERGRSVATAELNAERLRSDPARLAAKREQEQAASLAEVTAWRKEHAAELAAAKEAGYARAAAEWDRQQAERKRWAAIVAEQDAARVARGGR